jgi:D-threo-aldose 1-dehydrogenase
LGRNGATVPLFGLGCAPLGDLFDHVDEDAAAATLATAWDAGVRYFDTAPFYGWTKSEHRVGAALRTRPRDEFIVSTKVGRVFTPTRRGAVPPDAGSWVDPYPFDHHFDYSYDGIMRSYEDSLQRLGLNHVDLLVIHDLDLYFHRTPDRFGGYVGQLASSGWRALDELRRSGDVQAIGAGVNELGLIRRLVDVSDLDFVLVAFGYNLLNQTMLDDDFTICDAHGIDIVIGAVFASGILATGATPSARYFYEPATHSVRSRVQRLIAVCATHEVDLAAAAVQFPLAHPRVAAVIPGAVSSEQIEANLAAVARPIPNALWDDLRAADLLHADAPVPIAC